MADNDFNNTPPKRIGPMEALGQPWSNPTLVTPAWMALISDLMRGAGRGTLEDLHKPVETSRLPLGRTMPMPISRAPGGSVLGALPDNRTWQERTIDPMADQYSRMAKPVVGPDLGPEHGRVYTSPDLQEMRRNAPTSMDERYGGWEPTAHMIQRGQRDLGLPASPVGRPGGPPAVPPQPYDTRRDQQPGETMMGWIERLEREAGPKRARGGPIGYAGGGWAGEMDEMGMTPSQVAPKPSLGGMNDMGIADYSQPPNIDSKPLADAARTVGRGVRDAWLGDGKTRRERAMELADRVMKSDTPIREAFSQPHSTVLEASGIGPAVRSGFTMADPAASRGQKIAAGAEAALGVMPVASSLKMLKPVLGGPIRYGATYGTVGAVGDAADKGFLGSAQAAEGEKPVRVAQAPLGQDDPKPVRPEPVPRYSPENRRSPQETMQVQERLMKRGFYTPLDPRTKKPVDRPDGQDGNATRDAENAANNAKYEQDLDAWHARQKETSGTRLETEKATAARTQAETEAARLKKETADAIEAARLKKENDDKITGYEKKVSPGAHFWQTYGAPVAAIGAGAIYSGLAGYGASRALGARHLSNQARADRLIGSNPRGPEPLAEKIAKVNPPFAEGQAGPTRHNLYESTGKKPPYYEKNPAAPTTAQLYPEPSRKVDYMLGSLGAGTLPAIEVGFTGPRWLATRQELADARKDFLANPNDTTNATYRDAQQREATQGMLAQMGAIGSLGGPATSAYNVRNRPSMRPKKMDVLERRIGEIDTDLATRRTEETARAAAATAQKKKEKEKLARRDARKPQKLEAQAPLQLPKPRGEGGQGGPGGTTPLLPIAATPLLRRDQQSEEPTQQMSTASDDSYFEGFGRPYATGGEVGGPVKRHHSFFQPRKIGRFAGGPVYEEPVKRQHHSSFQPRKVGRFAGGPIWPRINRFDGGPIDSDTNVGRFAKPGLADPLREAARGATSGAALGALGPGLQGLLDRRRKEMEAEAYKSRLDGGRGDMMNAPSQFKPWRARGGATEGQGTPSVPHSAGPVEGRTGGRTDALNMTVAPGSYVLPADLVSGLPGAEGNTGAGMALLARQFGAAQRSAVGQGGVPIKISDGEFVLSPEQVAKVGGGDVSHGHRVLDAFVKRCRAHHIQTLSKLPPPAKT